LFHQQRDDNGSVTPLIVGMMLCLLILGAGVSAAGSAFLGGQRLQHLCDGAAGAAGGIMAGTHATDGDILAEVHTYLAIRDSSALVTARISGSTFTLTCTADVDVAFGSLFGSPSLHRTVTSSAHADYRRS